MSHPQTAVLIKQSRIGYGVCEGPGGIGGVVCVCEGPGGIGGMVCVRGLGG